MAASGVEAAACLGTTDAPAQQGVWVRGGGGVGWDANAAAYELLRLVFARAHAYAPKGSPICGAKGQGCLCGGRLPARWVGLACTVGRRAWSHVTPLASRLSLSLSLLASVCVCVSLPLPPCPPRHSTATITSTCVLLDQGIVTG